MKIFGLITFFLTFLFIVILTILFYHVAYSNYNEYFQWVLNSRVGITLLLVFLFHLIFIQKFMMISRNNIYFISVFFFIRKRNIFSLKELGRIEIISSIGSRGGVQELYVYSINGIREAKYVLMLFNSEIISLERKMNDLGIPVILKGSGW